MHQTFSRRRYKNQSHNLIIVVYLDVHCNVDRSLVSPFHDRLNMSFSFGASLNRSNRIIRRYVRMTAYSVINI